MHLYLILSIVFIVFIVLLFICYLTTILCKKHRQCRQKKKAYRQTKKKYYWNYFRGFPDGGRSKFAAVYDYNRTHGIPSVPSAECPSPSARGGAVECRTPGTICDKWGMYWYCDSTVPNSETLLLAKNYMNWNEYDTLVDAHKSGYSVPFKGEIDKWSGEYCVAEMKNWGDKLHGHSCGVQDTDQMFTNKWESITDKLTDELKSMIPKSAIRTKIVSKCPGGYCVGKTPGYTGMEGAICGSGYVCKNSTQSIVDVITEALVKANTPNMSEFGKTHTACSSGHGPVGSSSTCKQCPVNTYSFDGTECKMCPITKSYAGKEFATVSGVGSSTCGTCPHSKTETGERQYYSGRELCERWSEVAAKGAAMAGYHSYYSWLYDHSDGKNFIKNANLLYKYVNILCRSATCIDITTEKYKKFIRLATLVGRQTEAVRDKINSCGGDVSRCNFESFGDGVTETFDDLGEWLGEVIVDDILPMLEKLALEAATDLWKMTGLNIIVDAVKDFIVLLKTGKFDFSNLITDFERGGELWVMLEADTPGIGTFLKFIRNPVVVNDLVCEVKVVINVVGGKANINDAIAFLTGGMCNEVKNVFNKMLKEGFDNVLIVSDVSSKICKAAGFGSGVEGTLCTTMLSASINRELKKLTRNADRSACHAIYNAINKLCYSANKVCAHTELKSCLREGAVISRGAGPRQEGSSSTGAGSISKGTGPHEGSISKGTGNRRQNVA